MSAQNGTIDISRLDAKMTELLEYIYPKQIKPDLTPRASIHTFGTNTF